jgi:hypothetical protein
MNAAALPVMALVDPVPLVTRSTLGLPVERA